MIASIQSAASVHFVAVQILADRKFFCFGCQDWQPMAVFAAQLPSKDGKDDGRLCKHCLAQLQTQLNDERAQKNQFSRMV